MLVRQYEMPWRPAYEAYAAATWLLATAFFATVGVLGHLPRRLALPLALCCFVWGIFRGAQALRTLVLRASLGGRGVQTITTAELARWCQLTLPPKTGSLVE